MRLEAAKETYSGMVKWPWMMVWEDGIGRDRWTREYLLEVGEGLSLEGSQSDQHKVEQHPKGPHVHCRPTVALVPGNVFLSPSS